MDPIRIAIIGIGKIARDQHVPAIRGNSAFSLAATVSPHDAGLDGVPHHASLDELLEQGPAVDAVALCTPPQVRYDLAAQALAKGIHVFLEKPPGATLAEVAALSARADKVGASLFAAWHSRFAAGVAPARAWLAERRIDKVSIIWREDVRVWHPGQAWIWQPGGVAEQHVGAEIHMDLDWRQTGPQSWDIIVETDAGALKLSHGGAVLSLPSGTEHGEDIEYAGLYSRFATLIRGGRSDVDTDPLRLVADAFLRGKRETTDAFHD